MKNNKTYSTQDLVLQVLSRRDFLKIGLAVTGALSLPILAGCQPGEDVIIPVTPSAAPGTELFRQPKEIRSVGGVLKTSLLVKFKPIPASLPVPTATPGPDGAPLPGIRMYGSPNVPDPDPDNDDDWDFALPGPTWRIKAGDQVLLTLHNRLDPVVNVHQCEPAFYPTLTPTPAGTPSPTPDPGQTPTPTAFPDQFPDCFHENNVTNLHFHGLHVNQGPHADYVFLNLYPKDQQNMSADECVQIGDYTYNFTVPENHPQGTFWYHPHKHGSVALQIANGMCGTLIVEDNLKDDPAFNGQLKEYVMVFQTIQQTLNFPGGGHGKVSVFTVNGVQANTEPLPEITLKVGEVQRWRIVNATFQDQTDFNLQFTPTPGTTAAEPAVYFMAMDGYFVPEERWQKGTSKAEWFYSAPGNRTDFLVMGIEEGSFTLEGEPNISGSTQRPQNATPTPTPAAPATTPFLRVTVQGKMEPPMGIPEALPPLGEDQRPFTEEEIGGRKKTLAFKILPGSPGKYLISIDGQPGTQFDPNVVNECMEVNTAEEWTLENHSTPGHPFHIHLNPFYVTEYVDKDPQHSEDMKFNNPKKLWQDTILVPAAYTDPNTNLVTPGKVVFRHRFPDITGKFVLHCHILGHEDRGFMHIVEVHEKGVACSAPKCGH